MCVYVICTDTEQVISCHWYLGVLEPGISFNEEEIPPNRRLCVSLDFAAWGVVGCCVIAGAIPLNGGSV